MNEEIITKFTDYLHNTKGASNNTVVSYNRDLKKFDSFISLNGAIDISNSNDENIIEYIEYLKSKGFSDSTVSRNIATLKCFYRFLYNENIIDTNVLNELKAPKITKRTPGILTVEEVDNLLKQPSGDKPKAIRDRAMLELMYATGVRVSELISLKVRDVHLKGSYITCHDGNRKRMIPFGKEAKRALCLYLEKSRPVLANDKNVHFLFTNCSGNEMSRQGFWKLLKTYATKAGIDEDITPHTLRHTFAAHMIENGAEVSAVAEMLGHADITSTQIYVNMNNDRIKNIYNDAHPRK